MGTTKNGNHEIFQKSLHSNNGDVLNSTFVEYLQSISWARKRDIGSHSLWRHIIHSNHKLQFNL